MKRALLLCTLAASFIGFVGSARADEFTISFTGIGNANIISYEGTQSGSFIVDATALGSGAFQITGVESGGSVVTKIGTYDVTGISTSVPDTDNELFYPAAPAFFDNDGIAFTLSNGATINLYYYAGGSETMAFQTLIGGSEYFNGVNVTVTPVNSTSPVPEPGSLALLGTGVLGIVGTLRKRFLA